MHQFAGLDDQLAQDAGLYDALVLDDIIAEGLNNEGSAGTADGAHKRRELPEEAMNDSAHKRRAVPEAVASQLKAGRCPSAADDMPMAKDE